MLKTSLAIVVNMASYTRTTTTKLWSERCFEHEKVAQYKKALVFNLLKLIIARFRANSNDTSIGYLSKYKGTFKTILGKNLIRNKEFVEDCFLNSCTKKEFSKTIFR